MTDILSYGFIQNAIWAGVLASIACGIIGTLVVVNRIVFISGGIAHTAYGGIGLAFFLGISPLLGAGIFAVVAAVIMALITLKDKNRSDTVIGVMWACGMAFGIILADLTPGYGVDLMSYLFGSILAVPDLDLIYMGVLDVFIIAYVLLYFRQIHAVSFDMEYATSMGVRSGIIYTVLLVMSALAVVLLIRVVGLILVIAMLTIPPYIAEKKVSSLKGMMILSSILSLVFTLAGLYCAYVFNLTSGASIIAVSSVCFFLFIIYEKIRAVLRS
ncbi:metal ABC transporter permease [Seleniivibrio sp.]|uniref:metal ABC transporter permease n=1 Tax=Seleniivibrio sp. TaxID=2898801 RepID=UPI0025F40C57|nr:metal ABC transporter permease [Seleniivibrio sp.]MCD8552936.1 metal ABC transporter permease [Seleniivibrio sp.]